MRGHGTLMWMCGAVVLVALVVVLATGSAFPFLLVIGCVLMMGAMMFMTASAIVVSPVRFRPSPFPAAAHRPAASSLGHGAGCVLAFG